VLTSMAGRLARMEHRLKPEDDERIRQLAGGLSVKELSHQIVAALSPDRHYDAAVARVEQSETREREPTPKEIAEARQCIIQEAVKPLHDPKLREAIDEIKKKNEIVIDIISADEVLEATFSQEALNRARGVVQSFEQFIRDHKDEITALQVLYSRPYKQRLTFEAVKELADAIHQPPHLWTESQLWSAYAALEKSKVKGASGKRILTDLVSLVRYAIHQDNELIPFPERVNANFRAWLAQQQHAVPPLPPGEGRGEGKRFTPEQLKWLEMIRDHIAANLGIEPRDFEYAPFAQEGGLGKVHQLFGDKLNTMIEELNETLAA
jgi:type I restriction enzyme, R subunit